MIERAVKIDDKNVRERGKSMIKSIDRAAKIKPQVINGDGLVDKLLNLRKKCINKANQAVEDAPFSRLNFLL